MARLGELELQSRQQELTSGAAFSLATPAQEAALLRFGGCEIELAKDQRDALVRFRGPQEAHGTYEMGHEFVQRGLDLLSILGRVDAMVVDTEADHTLWWTEAQGTVVRLVATETMRFGVGHVTVEVRDSHGKLMPQPAPAPVLYHTAFRFYRLAQVSDDLYDAYRNMYLAFEALLSSQCPMRRGEHEIDWLQRALESASLQIQLADLFPTDTAEPIQELIRRAYKDARLPLFHAKEGRAFYAPQADCDEREAVASAIGLLTTVVLRMAEKWFNARRIGGGFILRWVYEHFSAQLEGMRMIASDSSEPFEPSESDLSHPRFREGFALNTSPAPDLQRGPVPALFGKADMPAMNGLAVLRRIDTVSAEAPMSAILLESGLTLDGVCRLEVLTHFRATNRNQPRSLFKT